MPSLTWQSWVVGSNWTVCVLWVKFLNEIVLTLKMFCVKSQFQCLMALRQFNIQFPLVFSLTTDFVFVFAGSFKGSLV